MIFKELDDILGVPPTLKIMITTLEIARFLKKILLLLTKVGVGLSALANQPQMPMGLKQSFHPSRGATDKEIIRYQIKG